MNDLFSTAEAEAARQLFYYMAKRPGVDLKSLRHAWIDANLGIRAKALDRALDTIETARAELGTPDQKRWALYSIQRQYREFLDNIGIREETVPAGPDGVARGEVVFYTPRRCAAFTPARVRSEISDFPGSAKTPIICHMARPAETVFPLHSRR